MAGINFSQFKALLIEDNDFVRFMIKKHLLGFGFNEVFEACNGQDGLEALDKQAPDLVICDIKMEPLDGFEFLRYVRSLSTPIARLPIIFLTSLADEGDVKKAMALEIDAYLLKPVMPNHLKRKIETLMTQKLRA